MKKLIGIICMIWGTIFCFLETEYFGNNFLPQSIAELICDVTSLLLVILGYNLFINHPDKKK